MLILVALAATLTFAGVTVYTQLPGSGTTTSVEDPELTNDEIQSMDLNPDGSITIYEWDGGVQNLLWSWEDDKYTGVNEKGERIVLYVWNCSQCGLPYYNYYNLDSDFPGARVMDMAHFNVYPE